MSETNSNSSENKAGENTDLAANASSSEVEELKAQVEKYKNDFLYLRAEFDNYKSHQDR